MPRLCRFPSLVVVTLFLEQSMNAEAAQRAFRAVAIVHYREKRERADRGPGIRGRVNMLEFARELGLDMAAYSRILKSAEEYEARQNMAERFRSRGWAGMSEAKAA